MDIGVGLPCTFRGVTRELLVDWSRTADAGPFASLSGGERIAFPNNDLMTMLAVAAGVTERIRLMTTVLVLPLHQPGVLTKQVATLDVLSGGRLTVGVGSGVVGRLDEYAITDVNYDDRAQRFEQHLALLQRLRAGEGLVDGVEPFSVSSPGAPELLIGGAAPRALRRAARFADGVVTFGVDPDPAGQVKSYQTVLDEWTALGRPGKPRFVAGLYFALGDDATDRAREHLGPYYASLGADAQEWMIRSITLTNGAAIREAIDRFADAGADEFYLTPAIADLDQLKALADIVV